MIQNLLDWFNNWKHQIMISNDQEFKEEIKQLKKQLVNKKKELQNLQLQYEALLNTHDNDQEEIKKLKQQLENLKPKKVNRPSWLHLGVYYKPKRRFVSKDYDFEIEFEDPRWVFDKSVYLHDLLKSHHLLNVKNKDLKTATKIYQLVKKRYKYQLDKKENWRPATETLLAGYGDCEDISVVITSALGMAGWNDDEVFVATGWYYPEGKLNNPKRKFGHAWTVAKINGEWWVLEGTSHNIQINRWKNVKDKYEASWGLMNWKFSGHLQWKGDHCYLDKE